MRLPDQTSAVIDYARPINEDSVGKPAYIALPVFIVRIIGHPRRTSTLDLFQHTCLRLIDAGINNPREITQLLGLEAELVQSALHHLEAGGFIDTDISLAITAEGRGHVDQIDGEVSDEISHIYVFFDPLKQRFWPTLILTDPPVRERTVDFLGGHQGNGWLNYMIGSEGMGEFRRVRIDTLPAPSDVTDLNDLDRWYAAIAPIVRDAGHESMAVIERLEMVRPAWMIVPVYAPLHSLTPRWVAADPITGRSGGWVQRRIEEFRQDQRFEAIRETINWIIDTSSHIAEGEVGQSLKAKREAARQCAAAFSYLPSVLGDGLVAFHYALIEVEESEGSDRVEAMGTAAKHAWAIIEASLQACLQEAPIDRQAIIDSIGGERMPLEPAMEALTACGFVIDEAMRRFVERALAVPTHQLKRTLRGENGDLWCQLYLVAQVAQQDMEHPLRNLARDCPQSLGVIQQLVDLRTRGSHAVQLEHGFSVTPEEITTLVHHWASWLSSDQPPPASERIESSGDHVLAKLRFRAKRQVTDLLGEDYSDLLRGLLVRLFLKRQQLDEIAEPDHPMAKTVRMDIVDTCYRAFEGLMREWLDRWRLPAKHQDRIPGRIDEAFHILSVSNSGCQALLHPNPKRLERAALRHGSTLAASTARLLLETAAYPKHPFRRVIAEHPNCIQIISKTCDARKHAGLDRIPPEQNDIDTITSCVSELFRFDAVEYNAPGMTTQE